LHLFLFFLKFNVSLFLSHQIGDFQCPVCPVCLSCRASLLYDFLARISRDLYETILVGKFPSREISEKCTSHRLRIIISSVPPYIAQCANSGGRSIECNGDMPAAAAAGGGDARHSLRYHHLCNWDMCCNN